MSSPTLLPTDAESRHGFRVPDGYFEQLEARILRQTVDAAPTAQPRRRFIVLRRLTAAAAIVALFATTLSLNTILKRGNTHPMQADNAQFDTHIDEMLDYVMYDEDALYAYLIDN